MDNNTQIGLLDKDQFVAIISSAPEALMKNRLTVQNANKASQALLDTISAEGMNDQLDAAVNEHLVKINKSIEVMNDRRKAATQIMDEWKSNFTTIETGLSTKTKGSLAYLLQEERDLYARKKVEDRKKAEAEAQRKLAKDRELVEQNSLAQTQLAAHFNKFLTYHLGKLNELFNSITLTNFDEVCVAITNYPIGYPHEHLNKFKPSLNPIYASTEEIEAIGIQCTKGKLGIFTDEFKTKIVLFKNEISDKFASRKTELQEIAQAEAEALRKAQAAKSQADRKAAEDERLRAEQMKAQADQRKRDEEIRLKEEEKRRTQESDQQIRTEEQAGIANTLFDAQASVASVSGPTATIRESYEIIVTNPIGYFLIAQFYFDREGKSESIEKLEKKTLGQMKKFCEKVALKTNEKIESGFVRYEEKVKTVAKKSVE